MTYSKLFDLKIRNNFKKLQFGKLKNFNFTVLKINILQFEKLLNILGVQIISKKKLIFITLIFAILKFRNIGRSTFRRSQF